MKSSDVSKYSQGIEYDHVEDFKTGIKSVKRINFTESENTLLVSYSQTLSAFRIRDLPQSVNLNLSEGIEQPRERYLGYAFQNLLHAAMEAFVLACATMEPERDKAQKYVRDFLYTFLCTMFATKVRHRDIVVVCDDTNNPPDSSFMTATIVFKPSVGIFSFCPITITFAEF